MGSLVAHEVRINRSDEKVEEKAFQVKAEHSYRGKSANFSGRGRGRGGYHGQSRGRSQFGEQHCGRSQFGEQHQFKGNIQCRYCKKFGHKEAECWSRRKDEARRANFAEKVTEEGNLFMAHSPINNEFNKVWFMDSGCSNHMAGTRLSFKELDETQKSEVRLGDDKQMKVEGKGTIVIKTSHGNRPVKI